MAQIQVQNLAIKAALTHKKRYIYYAALLDPLTSSILSMEETINMVEELVNAHSQYFKDFI